MRRSRSHVLLSAENIPDLFKSSTQSKCATFDEDIDLPLLAGVAVREHFGPDNLRSLPKWRQTA
jgi:hypothetical protein